jgi:hypothetical protein
MKDNRWFFVIPPDGAAKTVAKNISNAFKTIISQESIKIFDTFTYLSAFKTLLRNPDPDTTVDLLNQSLVVSSLDFGTTHILSGALSPLTLFTLNLLRKQGITTVHWFYEDYQKASYWKDVISGYDHFCAIQKGILPSECEKAGSKYHYLPTATCCACRIQPSERKFDIAFIGIPSPYRISILEHLACQGFHLLIAGSGWGAYEGILKKSIISNTWVDNEISFSLLNQSKIGLNISIENPSGRSDVHISPRAFDILASGCILLTEKVPLIADTLPLCKYHTFNSIEDAVIKACKILNDYESECMTAQQNIEIIISQHTYKNRATDILNYVND